MFEGFANWGQGAAGAWDGNEPLRIPPRYIAFAIPAPGAMAFAGVLKCMFIAEAAVAGVCGGSVADIFMRYGDEVLVRKGALEYARVGKICVETGTFPGGKVDVCPSAPV